MEIIKTKYYKKLYKKGLIKIIISFFIIIFIISIGISIYVGINLTSPERESLKNNPKDLGLIYEDVSFKSKLDGVTLKGWWIPAQNNKCIKNTGKTIIFSHGYGNNRGLYKISVMDFAKKLANEGYNILTFDFRACGESEGKYVTIGGMEKYDLLGAINFVKNEKHSKNINLVGWSMGAVTSILAASESKDVQAVIADSPFGNLKDYLEENLSYWSHLPNFFFTKTILYTLPKIRHFDIDEVNAIKAVEKLNNKKIFLIHSKDDEAIPCSNSEKIYNAIKDKKNAIIWYTSKAKHIKSYSLYKKEYEKKVINFLKEH
ncbi:hypothetical protein Z959_10295 [Clostridium novyi B str. ATCC 27606]|uniref:Serine aminopeptidase S33 domain-containing protein n=1 Tax=Clostridium novyi B str. ATCC 27606 TaxID=1443123 RepID=A0AA40M312_CLONO|nr:alpha/beta hydrolase [Clostridium novyi]KEI13922.1 hypothetical protein Z958_01485 [Clostridium novyi B str. NCTC 9691]KEI16263.1 hypothetical protein Z959_10295 [Clostridium novyi B str. ATCC 27606]